MASIILFEDAPVPGLYPATLGKPAFEISCGSYRLIDLVDRLSSSVRVMVRDHLRAIVAADSLALAEEVSDPGDAVLLINARLVPSVSAIARLGQMLKRGEPAVVYHGERIVAAFLPPGRQPPMGGADCSQLEDHVRQLDLPRSEIDLPLIDYPHDILRYHLSIFSENLEDRLARGDYREIADGVFVGPDTALGEYVVTDTGEGPIVLEKGVKIGPYCYLNGPVHIGAGSRVIEHAAVKDAVALGHTTKVGGEVEASIIEPYTNKQHHGFLGHSYLGSWVNLGAGTCNSDLKNTYGTVTMEYDGHRVPTDMQFVGCIVGDYVKTAINTSIFTGKTIGACSMVYGFVTTGVPSFVNYARSFGQVTEVPVEVIIAAQSRMFKRRNVVQRPCDVQLLHSIYELTSHERQMADEPLSL